MYIMEGFAYKIPKRAAFSFLMKPFFNSLMLFMCPYAYLPPLLFAVATDRVINYMYR
jgi:hypothetical protein